ncbi:MAG: glutamate--tRNA ligase [Gammaproteobacteria bacterium]|nr:glutamate--tRNA ligase [Gammaproteobacteria bacterium]
MTIKTRFAPSPTGFLHIGGVRTALFCWLFARHHGGKFLLRVEDTDRERSTQESINAILRGMDWVGLDWDEGPYFQTDRFDRYLEVRDSLLEGGHAYHCYCAPEELEEMRARQMAAGENPQYDGRCRERNEPREGVDPVVRFKTPRDGEVIIDDAVRGRVVFANSELDDLVIVRSDGTPTYHFSVVIDDADMDITHVIRGDDHLNNTPWQINIIEALGFQRPAYAHLPMILGEDGARLSKRHGAVNVLEYEEQGYLPDALLNYLVRLGWSHGDQEIFSRDEMIELFRLEDVNAAASRFSPEKLTWLNQQYIIKSPAEDLVPALQRQLEAIGLDPAAGPPLGAVIEGYRERAATLRELAASCGYLFSDFDHFDPKAARKNLRPIVGAALAEERAAFAALDDWRADDIQDAIQQVADRHELAFGKIGQPLRVSVTGAGISPPIDVTIRLVGRERTLQRLDMALEYIAQRAARSGGGIGSNSPAR